LEQIDSMIQGAPSFPSKNISNSAFPPLVSRNDKSSAEPSCFITSKATNTSDRPPALHSQSGQVHPQASSHQHSALSGRKAWKANTKIRRLVLGDGVGLESLVKMSTSSLVGRISYKSLSPPPLEAWIKHNWCPLLGYAPEVHYLKKGWICFSFRTPDDAALILSSSWVFGGSSIMLKRWRMEFNPDNDYFPLRHLWVLLPGLPLHFWNEDALREIGNSLGKTITVDTSSRSGSSRLLGRVLVEIDITKGLPSTLEIEWRGRKIHQQLDYLGIPFRCSRCRETGHLRRSCPGKPSTSHLDESEDLYLNPPAYLSTDPSLDFLEALPLAAFSLALVRTLCLQ
jgi:hypothetical protein